MLLHILLVSCLSPVIEIVVDEILVGGRQERGRHLFALEASGQLVLGHEALDGFGLVARYQLGHDGVRLGVERSMLDGSRRMHAVATDVLEFNLEVFHFVVAF